MHWSVYACLVLFDYSVSFRPAARCWCRCFCFSICSLWIQQLLKVRYINTAGVWPCFVLVTVFDFVLQWVSVVKCFCSRMRLISATLNSHLKSHWALQRSLSACASRRSSRASGRSFSSPTARPTSTSSTCGERETAACPSTSVATERSSTCLLSPPSGFTCASPGARAPDSRHSGWMGAAARCSCINRVTASTRWAPLCSARTPINTWATSRRCRVSPASSRTWTCGTTSSPETRLKRCIWTRRSACREETCLTGAPLNMRSKETC